MAKYTEHYRLHQWEPGDSFLRTDFNEDFQKLDAAIAEIEAGKAEQSEVAQLRAALAEVPKTAAGSYTGSGGLGKGSPNRLTFSFAPKVVVIVDNSLYSLYQGTVLIAGQTRSAGIGTANSSSAALELTVAWEGNTVSWYTATSKTEKQFNYEGVQYFYWAAG